jgi:hypothetical protein
VKANPQVKNPHPNTRSGDGRSPSFVGGGVTPMVTKNVDGLTSAQSGGADFPDPAIATDLSYVMEGVNGAIAIYRASTGALQYGPYATSSFFAPVSSGVSPLQPQMYYDVMRDRWVVAALQFNVAGQFGAYLDIAISVSNSPTQPSPGGQYYIYQLPANFEKSGSSHCVYFTMGADYWGLCFTCVNNTDLFVGNTMLAVSKADLYSGGDYTAWIVNDGLQRADGGPAFATSPAIEEGCRTPSSSSPPI